MNTKTAIGLIAALIVLVVAFFLLHKPAVDVPLPPTTATSTSATTTTSIGDIPTTPSAHGPSIVQEKPRAVKVAAVDQSTLMTKSLRPTITGTASVKLVAIVLDDPQGVGIAGTDKIEVVNGHWSWTPPQMLKPGVYTIHLIGGDAQVNEKLTITQ